MTIRFLHASFFAVASTVALAAASPFAEAPADAGIASNLSLASTVAIEEVDYEADVEFALSEMERMCGHFFKGKGIDWKKVTKQFRKEAKGIETLQDELVLLTRLVARLEDGHAYAIPKGAAKDVKWPDDGRAQFTGPGIFLCKIGKKIYVKSNSSSAPSVEPGSEVIKINGTKAAKWMDEQVEKVREYRSFSTDQHAFFYTCVGGLKDVPGEKLKLDVKRPSGKKTTHKLTYRDATTFNWGPAFFPSDRVKGGELSSSKNVNWGLLDSGIGYVHIRRCKGTMPDEVQGALDALAGCEGLIVDFRGNSGGGFDHSDFFGRFLPEGESFGSYKSTGENPYTGPMVVIVDGTVVSAGETASGILKEDGRAYMIGESATAGMSSSKEMIELPSGNFDIRVSVYSNKKRFNGGAGIEGIGVPPHELVEFDPEDLAEERDTLTMRAEELLLAFPKSGFPASVPFRSR